MQVDLRNRFGCSSFGLALGASLVLHVAVIGLAPEAHRHERVYAGPLVVQLPPAAASAPRLPVSVSVPVPKKPQSAAPVVPERPAARPRQPRPRQLMAPFASSPPLLSPSPRSPVEPTAPDHREPPVAVPQAAPELPVPAKEGPRATSPVFAAAYLNNPKPAYPASARRNGETGTAIVKVLVTGEGLPGRVELENSSGVDVLDQSALDTVKRWRFTPATRGGDPVEAWVRVPIEFRLEVP